MAVCFLGFFCQITEFSELTEGPSKKISSAGEAGQSTMSVWWPQASLAGPLFMALCIQDVEPELPAHLAGKMHAPKEVQDKREA